MGVSIRLPAAFHRLMVVVVALASMLSMQWHEAAVVHVRCNAHGEMSHLGAGGRSVVGAEAAAGPAGEARLDQGTTAELDDDDHCQVIGSTCSEVARVEAPVAIAGPATLLAVTAPPFGAPAARATFRLAPKTSPPV